jgi:hypothetical protein
MKIKPKEWIDKKTWRKINDILRIQMVSRRLLLDKAKINGGGGKNLIP